MEILGKRFDENAERIYEDRRVAQEKTDAGCENDHPAIKNPRSLRAHLESPIRRLCDSNAGESCCGPTSMCCMVETGRLSLGTTAIVAGIIGQNGNLGESAEILRLPCL